MRICIILLCTQCTHLKIPAWKESTFQFWNSVFGILWTLQPHLETHRSLSTKGSIENIFRARKGNKMKNNNWSDQLDCCCKCLGMSDTNLLILRYSSVKFHSWNQCFLHYFSAAAVPHYWIFRDTTKEIIIYLRCECALEVSIECDAMQWKEYVLCNNAENKCVSTELPQCHRHATQSAHSDSKTTDSYEPFFL